MEFIKQNDKILLLWDAAYDLAASGFNADTIKTNFNANINFENIERLSLGKNNKKLLPFRPNLIFNHIHFHSFAASYGDSTFTFIIVKTNDGLDIPFFASLLKLLKPSGRILVPAKDANQLLENLKLAGFINTDTKENGKVKMNIQFGHHFQCSTYFRYLC